MRTFRNVILAACAAAGSASAMILSFVGTCGSFSNPAPNSPMSNTWVCPSAAALGDLGVVAAEYVVYNSDYSSGLDSAVTTVTNWSFSGTTFAFATDTTTSTGGPTSTPAVSTDGLAFNAISDLPPLLLAGFYDVAESLPFGTPTINWTNDATVGSAIEATGYAQVVYVTNSNTIPAIPEPDSMWLVGAGLFFGYLRGGKNRKSEWLREKLGSTGRGGC